MAKTKVIFDTDPGVDDALALLLALAASPEQMQILLISVTHGNVPLKSCLKNVVSVFHVLDKELAWRKAQGKPEGFGALKAYKPIVAAGADHALEEEILREDGFHGPDGLHNVHATYPHLSPEETWQSLFEDGVPTPNQDPSYYSYFTPSKLPAHKEILRVLAEEPENTVSICAVGPMTNLALAAAEDPKTFLRVKEVCVMGGAVEVPGNITPVAEFNTYADAIATARVLALTSGIPSSTMPVVQETRLGPYQEGLPKPLRLTLFPLDITTPHLLGRGFFYNTISAAGEGSPLATWITHIVGSVYRRMERIRGPIPEPALPLHDPLVVWYLLSQEDEGWQLAKNAPEDIRIETSGQWTHGMHILDRRGRPRAPGTAPGVLGTTATDEIPGDDYGWLSARRGNRVNRIVGSPGVEKFAHVLMDSIFA
ncbi:inosine-uridine preferring nucleoside hydrolase [Poronia punctata]|nr:inosine-uridine preferring nucleoside hydrolase [Poronia punctata]